MIEQFRVSTRALFKVGAHRFGRPLTEAGRFGRFLVTGGHWPPGRGGHGAPGQVITTFEEAAAYVLALLASDTARDCAEAVKVYRDLATNDDINRTLGRDLAALIAAACTPEGRERLEAVQVWVVRTRPRARIVVNGETTEYFDLLGRGPTKRQKVLRAAGADADLACVISEATIKDFGAALDAAQNDDAPSTAEAEGASSGVSRHRRANAGKLLTDTEHGSEREGKNPPRSQPNGGPPDPTSLGSTGDDRHDDRRPPRRAGPYSRAS